MERQGSFQSRSTVIEPSRSHSIIFDKRFQAENYLGINKIFFFRYNECKSTINNNIFNT